MHSRAIAFGADGLTLEGSLVLPERPRALVILCHGIPGGGPPDPSDEGYAGFARTIASVGYAALWFNFRGAREAPGEFSIAGWRRDLDAAVVAVRARDDLRDVPMVIVGSSAGAAAAISVAASRDDVAGVATLAAPAVFEFGGFAGDAGLLVQRFRNLGLLRDPAFPSDQTAWLSEFEQEAPEVHVRALAPRALLLLHGDADDVVPYLHAERLFNLAGEPKELVRIPGGGHQLRRDPRAIDAFVDWLDHLPLIPANSDKTDPIDDQVSPYSRR